MEKLQLIFIIFIIKTQNFIFNCLSSSFRKSDGKKILVLRVGALGDFIMAVPALSLLRRIFPTSSITLLTSTTSLSLHREKIQDYTGKVNYPWIEFVSPSIVDHAFCIDSFSFRNLLVLRKTLRDNFYDLAVILPNPGENGLSILKKIIFIRVLGFSGVIYGHQQRSNNKIFRAAQYNAGLFEHHVIQPIKSVLEITGEKYNPNLINFTLSIAQNDMDWARDFIASANTGNGFFAIAPGAIMDHKKWPINSFLSLCELIINNFNVTLLIIGTSEESYLGDIIASKFEGFVYNLCGISTINQSAAVLKYCRLLVGNDGGAIHLGTAVGCPTVSIVPGIEYPDSIEPWFSKEFSVRKNLECSPCYSFNFCPKGHKRCMYDIEVLSVFNMCEKSNRDNSLINYRE
jgi:heptosyltransferase-2